MRTGLRVLGTALALLAVAVAAYGLGEGSGREAALRLERHRRQQLEPFKRTLVNEGGACFERTPEGRVTGVTAPLSCTPSCYRHDLKHLVVVLDRRRKALHLQTLFQSTQTSACVTADCNGAPKAAFDLGRLEVGTGFL